MPYDPCLDVLSTLRAARALISHPNSWTQGEGQPLFRGARDAQGQHCWPSDPQAVCWCANGAIAKIQDRAISYETPDIVLGEGLSYAFGYFPTTSYFNDRRSHSDVLAMFDAAIEIQKKRHRDLVLARLLRDEPTPPDLLRQRAEAKAFVAKFMGEAD